MHSIIDLVYNAVSVIPSDYLTILIAAYIIMKLEVIFKKFPFLKSMELSDAAVERMAKNLVRTIKGVPDVFVTPLGRKVCPVTTLTEWDEVYNLHRHKMNDTLLELEHDNREKFGPRSRALSWSHRVLDLRKSYGSQDDKHIPKFKFKPGKPILMPISLLAAARYAKLTSSAGLPYMKKKGDCIEDLVDNFDRMRDRDDPCVLFTRTTENKKTRNVWGYPFADTLYEMMFYIPILELQKEQWYRAALLSPEMVAQRITVMIKTAIATGRLLYSVDFAGFDASVKHQYITCAFDYIKSCFAPIFAPYIDRICVRFYSIGIVTPGGIWVGRHGIPSGSTFTNEIDSIVQYGIASTLPFIHGNECQIQGDDGAYIVAHDDVGRFKGAFKYAGLKLEESKSKLSENYVLFCQHLYHIDYIDEDGEIGGIYPLYRALNRLLFQERFVVFGKAGMSGRDYYGIRTLTILEKCKHHPLFEVFVEYIVMKEQFNLDVSDEGLIQYCEHLNPAGRASDDLNHRHGDNIGGLREFASYKYASKIIQEYKAAVAVEDSLNMCGEKSSVDTDIEE